MDRRRLDTSNITMNLTRRTRTLLLTLAGLGAVLTIGLWDAQHEDVLAIQQLTGKHHLLAVAISAALDSVQGPSPHSESFQVMGHSDARLDAFQTAVRQIESRGKVVVLLMDSLRGDFTTTDGSVLQAEPLKSALLHDSDGMTLDREMAARLGLPRRIAVAGLAATRNRNQSRFQGVAVVASAQAERDRNRREQLRTVFGVLIVSGLIIGVGISALRNQRRELALEQQQALYQLERARDTELARANRMATIAALSSGIAHEISTPLGVIAGRIEQLRAAVQGQTRYERILDTISSQVGRVDTVMRGFLAFARGKSPEFVRVLADSLARGVVEQVKYRFFNARVRLEFIPFVDRNLAVNCAPTLFEQVLVDILINACEASKPGQQVTFTVAKDAHLARFIVSDEGSGISESIVARVTEPFFTTKDVSGGTGLGLAIAREIIVHHRGELNLERRSTVEGMHQPGTRVTVKLQLAEEVPSERSS
jgi:two-component system, NtrC family, sensor kinase